MIDDQSVGRAVDAVDAVAVVEEKVDAAIDVVLSAAVEVSVGGFAAVVAINATVVDAGGGFAGAVYVAAFGYAFDGSLGCLVGLHPVHLMTEVFQILPECRHYLKSNLNLKLKKIKHIIYLLMARFIS